MPRFILVAAWGLLLLLGSGVSSAQTARSAQASGPDCFQDDACRDLHDEGRQHVVAGRFNEAQRLYTLAYQHVADPMLLWKIARLLDQAERLTEALLYYQKYLESGDLVKRHEAELRLVQLNGRLSEKTVSLSVPSPVMTSQSAKPIEPVEASVKQPPVNREYWRKWWLWTLAGAGVAGIVVGVGLGVASIRPDVTNAAMVQPFPN